MWHGVWRPDWGEDAPQARFEWPLLQRVFSYFGPYWAKASLVIALILVGAVVGLAPVYVTKDLVDFLSRRPTAAGLLLPHKQVFAIGPFQGQGVEVVLVLVVILILAAVIGGLLGVLQSYFSNTISQGIMYDLRNQLFRRILRQSVAFFTRTRTGDVMSRLSNDVNGVQSVVSDTVFSLIQNAITLAVTIGAMVQLDWKLTIAALAVVPAFMMPTRRVGRATFNARKRTQSKLSELTAYMQEVLGISGILLVKAFVRQEAESRKFRGLNGDLRDLNVRQTMIGRWFFMLMAVLGTAGPAVLWLYGGYLIISGQLSSVGTVVTFATVLLAKLYGPVGSIANLQVNVIGSLALFQRLFEYLDLPLEITDRAGARDLGQASGGVDFEQVSFSYGPKGRPALQDVSFAIEPGQLIALVGPSGAGKTTVTSLLPRFYDPQAGVIRIDGIDIRDLTLESLGRQIGIVFQDTFLFHSSIRDNLLYVRPEASEEEIVAAARAAYIHDFIESLPQGYETLVGERGHRLSGGEKQRLAIARVILKDPRILILDEATSNLDSESERFIQAALQPLFQGRTSIVIAHRLSTILAADQILVLDRGRLVERGTHFDLLTGQGVYSRLYESQFRTDELRAAAPA
ncbi:MAG: ABC transporter ATP-binding protein [Candidatus Dormibacteraceae bacterium]